MSMTRGPAEANEALSIAILTGASNVPLSLLHED